MQDTGGREWESTTWDMIDAAVDTAGYREGFVKVFLEFRGAVLDDTFHRWLGEWGGAEFAVEGERKEKAEAAKERQSAKAKRKDRDAVAQEVRRKVAESREDFAAKRAVRKADDEFWFIDVASLLESELPGREKAAEIERWYQAIDEEVQALQETGERLLAWLTEHDATDGASAA
jgi:hypothetical protein